MFDEGVNRIHFCEKIVQFANLTQKSLLELPLQQAALYRFSDLPHETARVEAFFLLFLFLLLC